MLRGPSEISSWFEKRFFSTHMKVAFLSVCFRAFFWVHKSISGNAHHVHQYIFLISFFSALSLNTLLSDEKSKKQKVRRETRAIARDGPCKQRRTLSEEREKYTSDFDSLFSSSFLRLWVLRLRGLFSLFFGWSFVVILHQMLSTFTR